MSLAQAFFATMFAGGIGGFLYLLAAPLRHALRRPMATRVRS